MNASLKRGYLVLVLLVSCVPALASAHQPRVVESRQTLVPDPGISKAYYGKLTGVPDIFTIRADAPFDLYVNILVPDIAGQGKDVSVAVSKDGAALVDLAGTGFAWTPMFEPFGYDAYWAGPEYRTGAQAGTYLLTVTSARNDSKYVLAVGEAENFDFPEIMNALTVVPQLKRGFFDESPISFVFSVFGWGLILTLYLLAGVLVLAGRFVAGKLAPNPACPRGENVGPSGRAARLVLGVALLFLAISTTWNLVLIFLSGFVVFEAAFSWCGLNAILGKNERSAK